MARTPQARHQFGQAGGLVGGGRLAGGCIGWGSRLALVSPQHQSRRHYRGSCSREEEGRPPLARPSPRLPFDSARLRPASLSRLHSYSYCPQTSEMKPSITKQSRGHARDCTLCIGSMHLLCHTRSGPAARMARCTCLTHKMTYTHTITTPTPAE